MLTRILTVIFLAAVAAPVINYVMQNDQFVFAAPAFVYNDGGRRDPFEPQVDSAGTVILYDNELILRDLKVEGILLDPKSQNGFAIINGRIVKIHDKIGAFHVENILKDRVILRKDQETFELKLKKE